MIMKSIIVFAVLDDGSIRQILLSEEEKEVIKSTINLISNDTIKCSHIDFNDVMQLPGNE